MRILYLHGLASGANSMTVDILKKTFKGTHDIVAFDLYHNVGKSIKLITDFLEHKHVDLIIATSLGAYYALCVKTDVPKILFNPAFRPQTDLKQFLGYNKYFVKRQDDKEEGFVLTQEHLDKFRNYSPLCATENDTIILSSKDEILKNSLLDHIHEIAYLMYEKRVNIKTTNLCGHSMSAKFVKTELSREIARISLEIEP